MQRILPGLILVLVCSLISCGRPPVSQSTVTVTNTFRSAPTSTIATAKPPSPTPLTTSTAAGTPDPNRFSSADGAFSLVPPQGWKAVDTPRLDYPILQSPEGEGYHPRLTFQVDTSDFVTAFYAARLQDALIPDLVDYRQIGEEYVNFTEDNTHFRWEFEHSVQGQLYHQVVYFFESGTSVLVITYTRLAGEGAENDPLINRVMETVQFTP